jgi:hypothetical protein
MDFCVRKKEPNRQEEEEAVSKKAQTERNNHTKFAGISKPKDRSSKISSKETLFEERQTSRGVTSSLVEN